MTDAWSPRRLELILSDNLVIFMLFYEANLPTVPKFWPLFRPYTEVCLLVNRAHLYGRSPVCFAALTNIIYPCAV